MTSFGVTKIRLWAIKTVALIKLSSHEVFIENHI